MRSFILIGLKQRGMVMKTVHKFKIILLAFVTCILLSSSVFAYSVLGSKWQDSEANMEERTSGGPAYSAVAIQDAMDNWTDIRTSSFQFNDVGDAATSTIGYDGVNKIAFGEMSGGYIGYCWWWNSGSKILESDVKIRSNYVWNQTSLTSVITHELGHTLGLGHSSNYSAIMYAYMHGQSSLHQDDINGVSYLYPGGYVFKGLGNIDDDIAGTSDIVWVDRGTGEVHVWLMDGLTDAATLESLGDAGVIDTVDRRSWRLYTQGDYNGDGKKDVLAIRPSDGMVAVWLLDGITPVSTLEARGDTELLHNTFALRWRLKAIGDFNGDGRDDLLWMHSQTGKVVVWLMDGATPLATLVARGDTCELHENFGMKFLFGGIGDFDGDGCDDIVWYRSSDGMTVVWLLDGATPAATLQARGDTALLHEKMARSFQISGIGDFNGDDRDDIIWRHSSTGMVVIWLMDGGTSSYTLLARGDTGVIHDTLSLLYQIQGIADFNGDGRDDILWRHQTNGSIIMWLVDGVTSAITLQARGDTGVIHPGLSSYVQIIGLGDFNGDSKTDVLCQVTTTGAITAWLMDGVTPWETLNENLMVGELACKEPLEVKD